MKIRGHIIDYHIKQYWSPNFADYRGKGQSDPKKTKNPYRNSMEKQLYLIDRLP